MTTPIDPPPRAYSQGVGTVFQFVGVMLFLVMMFICCGSGLISKDVATQSNLTNIGWGSYTAQRALTISVFGGVLLGMALACVGLGLQAQSRVAAPGGVIACAIGFVFFAVQTVFAAQAVRSITFTLIALPLTAMFGILFALVLAAAKEMRRDPPPRDMDVLPLDYKIPYSHYLDDPPEIRLARELDQRRQRLAVQQKELEMLEEKLKKELDKGDEG